MKPLLPPSYAEDIIATMERDTKSRKARLALAKMAIERGNYDADACLIWRAYILKDAT